MYERPVWQRLTRQRQEPDHLHVEHTTSPMLSLAGSTAFSHEERLVWESISLEDGGVYQCQAQALGSTIDRQDEQSLKFTVWPIEPPKVSVISEEIPKSSHILPAERKSDKHERRHNHQAGRDPAGTNLSYLRHARPYHTVVQGWLPGQLLAVCRH